MNKRRRHSSALHKNKIAMSGTSNKTNIKSRTDRRIVFVLCVAKYDASAQRFQRNYDIPEEIFISLLKKETSKN